MLAVKIWNTGGGTEISQFDQWRLMERKAWSVEVELKDKAAEWHWKGKSKKKKTSEKLEL